MSLTGVPVTFKEVFTTNTYTFRVNPWWTVTQFLETMTPHLRLLYNMEAIDIVVTGQDAPGIPAEAGQPLLPSDICLKNKWGRDMNVSFYVRNRNRVYPQLENLNTNTQHLDTDINPIITQSVTENECPICLTNSPTLQRFRCRHVVCNNCYYTCSQNGFHICSVCRST
jgi:hypothetical protein